MRLQKRQFMDKNLMKNWFELGIFRIVWIQLEDPKTSNSCELNHLDRFFPVQLVEMFKNLEFIFRTQSMIWTNQNKLNSNFSRTHLSHLSDRTKVMENLTLQARLFNSRSPINCILLPEHTRNTVKFLEWLMIFLWSCSVMLYKLCSTSGLKSLKASLKGPLSI